MGNPFVKQSINNKQALFSYIYIYNDNGQVILTAEQWLSLWVKANII